MPSARRKKGTGHGGLTFVNVQHPDDLRLKCTQTVIRSGAMAAIGLARRKRPRPVTIDLEVKEHVPYRRIASKDPHGDANAVMARQPTGSANAEPWLPSIAAALPHLGHFAVEPDRRARELLSFMDGEASYIYRPFRAEWFNMAVLEPSAYYLCLANAALFLNQFLTGHGRLEYTDCVESSKYYGLCLSRVTGQLADQSRGITQGLVTTVLGFVCHNLSLGNWDRCDMHLEGLERIISARGGFHKLGPYVPHFASW
ncbi:unnamed protein product [Clonostachys rosea]|uniref:Transcription factor domain-containing protein n=1 Tax=Bionectria ochroleuca TaxID=29856 RepID=A0ABY6UZE6_BIOOC|nr:unnamed protein product [Clonostachys rosea]